jgi:hypothetical protein
MVLWSWARELILARKLPLKGMCNLINSMKQSFLDVCLADHVTKLKKKNFLQYIMVALWASTACYSDSITFM